MSGQSINTFPPDVTHALLISMTNLPMGFPIRPDRWWGAEAETKIRTSGEKSKACGSWELTVLWMLWAYEVAGLPGEWN